MGWFMGSMEEVGAAELKTNHSQGRALEEANTRTERLASHRRFLGQPVNVAQRWGREGMPVSRKGRYVIATPDELNSWLGRESGEPVHVATSTTDLASEMKRGLQFVRQQKGATKRRK
jgi:hypothetical protein